ncbi:hypothetical protein ACLMJK_006049 [Lecanora helva]
MTEQPISLYLADLTVDYAFVEKCEEEKSQLRLPNKFLKRVERHYGGARHTSVVPSFARLHLNASTISRKPNSTSLAEDDDFPNPYPLPGKPYTLAFDYHEGWDMPDRETIICIFEGFRRFREQIRLHGNTPLPVLPAEISVQYGEVYFDLYRSAEPNPLSYVLRYDDAILILGTLSRWITKYGNLGWYAVIYIWDEHRIGGASLDLYVSAICVAF